VSENVVIPRSNTYTVVNNMFTLSLNVFLCLNACGLYNACMSYVQRGVIVVF
jgi:hypothetical protein